MQTRHGLAVVALLAAAAPPPLHGQDGDPPGGSDRDTPVRPPVPALEAENAVPGWECPMPIAGRGAEDPSAPSVLPVVPIDSAATVPMPTLRRHCLNPRAIPRAGSRRTLLDPLPPPPAESRTAPPEPDPDG